MGRQLRTTTVAALAVITVLAAGCSSSSGSSSSGEGKSPIRLMVETTMTPAASLGGLSFPSSAVGARAAAAALNAKGGIDGHPVQIDVCDNQGSPDQSAACGRKAKSNGDIAVAGSWDVLGANQILPVLQAESIPDVGPMALTTAEVANPDSFSFDAAPLVGTFAQAGVYHQEGCKNVVEFLPSSSPSVPAEVAGQKAIAAADGYRLQTITITTGQADLTAPISAGMSMHPDCASYIGDGQTNVKVIAGLRQAGYKGKIFTAIGSLQVPFLKSLGQLGNGIITLNTALDPTSADPGVTAFRSQVTAYAGSPSAAAADLNEFAQDAWSSVRLVDLALAGTGSYTSAELLKKLPTMCDVNLGNYYPSVDFCKPAAHSTVFPRVFNDQWRYYVAQNGQYVSLGDQWHDFASTIPAGA